MSDGDSGSLSSKHEVDGLESNMLMIMRTKAELTFGLVINLSITKDIAWVTWSSVAMNVDIVPTSSIICVGLPLVFIPTLDPFPDKHKMYYDRTGVGILT
jgi:hypothetical protein